MVLAQKQTHRSMEQNREPRNKPMYLWSVNLIYSKEGKIHIGEKTISSITGIGKTAQLCIKELN